MKKIKIFAKWNCKNENRISFSKTPIKFNFIIKILSIFRYTKNYSIPHTLKIY